MIPSLANDKVIRGYGAKGHKTFSEVQFYLHLRTVFLLSAAQPGTRLKFSSMKFFSSLFLGKTDQQSSNCLKHRREYVFPDCDTLCPPF